MGTIVLYVIIVLVCFSVLFVVLRGIYKKKEGQEPKDVEAYINAYRAHMEAISPNCFLVDKRDLSFIPDEKEVFFYTPVAAPEIENAIASRLDEIKSIFLKGGYRFVFLPDFNKTFNQKDVSSLLSYYNPRLGISKDCTESLLSYEYIKQALSIPDKVDGPCFIECTDLICPLATFCFSRIQLSDDKDIIKAASEFSKSAGGKILYSIASKDSLDDYYKDKSADERFAYDIRTIGDEIRERLAILRSKGLTELAIRRLIGDDSDKPGKLFIDKHHKVFLPDYGNKEIKMEPLQKAVFFLFMKHPEGIYFKDLSKHKNELYDIYEEITGRDDLDGIKKSIRRLTDPYDNSINEKCARIKNAFVSEFREEVAQWYFIDGAKGEKKRIKLPRDLVTWENQV